MVQDPSAGGKAGSLAIGWASVEVGPDGLWVLRWHSFCYFNLSDPLSQPRKLKNFKDLNDY